ncbi:hypothetical protein [uncultured Desulfovibrio sp.]|uniref:restriction endonuclease subunit S n=1 Tax=uncultured Desulfovibrio sp. TaxID=167968 RepID=UPI00261C115E|nr:hypothetical protein [uncultured Desulfovibrio sp.]
MEVPLQALAELRVGYPFRTRVVPDPQGETAIVQLSDLSGETLHTDKLTRVHLTDVKPHFHLRRHDILFRSRSMVNDATLLDAPPKLPPGVKRLVAAAPIIIIRPRQVLEASIRKKLDLPPTSPAASAAYLHWLLNHPRTQSLLRSRSTGDNAEVLRKGDLSDLPIPLPPREAQALIMETAALLHQELRYRRQLIEDRRTMVEDALLHHARHIDTAFYERSQDAPDMPSLCEQEEEGDVSCSDVAPEPPFRPDARTAAAELETLMADLADDTGICP